MHQWTVPYNVVDDAGNEAKTVWRDIIVEEVDIEDFERMAMQNGVVGHRGEEDHPVTASPTNERRLHGSPSQHVCPPCDPCNCSNYQQKQHRGNGGDDGVLSSSECMILCDNKIAAAEMTRTSDKTCTQTFRQGGTGTSEHQIIQELLSYLEGLMGPSAMMLLFLGCFISTIVYLLQRAIAALFISSGPHTRTYYHTKDDDEREMTMMQNVSYNRSPAPSSNGGRQSPGSASSFSRPRPPTDSISLQRNGIFSTRPQQANPSPFRSNDGTDSIYKSASPITPLRHSNQSPGSQGDGRSPYS